jgi:hypothetical protein
MFSAKAMIPLQTNSISAFVVVGWIDILIQPGFLIKSPRWFRQLIDESFLVHMQ